MALLDSPWKNLLLGLASVNNPNAINSVIEMQRRQREEDRQRKLDEMERKRQEQIDKQNQAKYDAWQGEQKSRKNFLGMLGTPEQEKDFTLSLLGRKGGDWKGSLLAEGLGAGYDPKDVGGLLSAPKPEPLHWSDGKAFREVNGKVVEVPIQDGAATGAGGAGRFGDKDATARLMNIVYDYETSVAKGLPKTPDDEYAYRLAKNQLEAATQGALYGTPETGYVRAPAIPVPGFNQAPTAKPQQGVNRALPVASATSGNQGMVIKPMKDPTLTEAQQKTVDYGIKAINANQALEASDYNPTGLKGFADRIFTGSDLTNWLATESGQTYYNNGRAFLAAVLRKESGAQVTKDEWDKFTPLYIPLPGDKPQVIEDKKARREAAIKGMTESAGEYGKGIIDRVMPSNSGGSGRWGDQKAPPKGVPVYAIKDGKMVRVK